VAAFLYWPLRNGHAYLDDFLFLALARHIDDPLWLLTRDSTGLFFFRPVGMFVSWLTVGAFGERAPLHIAFNVVLHASNGVLLHAVSRRMGIATWPAAIVAVLFVAHPAAFAASAWIADRFDLLALAFSLLSMLATLRLRSRFSAGNALLVAAALLAAMLSKESGFAAPVACALLFCLPGADGSTRCEVNAGRMRGRVPRLGISTMWPTGDRVLTWMFRLLLQWHSAWSCWTLPASDEPARLFS